jgi:hypothetical protein
MASHQALRPGAPTQSSGLRARRPTRIGREHDTDPDRLPRASSEGVNDAQPGLCVRGAPRWRRSCRVCRPGCAGFPAGPVAVVVYHQFRSRGPGARSGPHRCDTGPHISTRRKITRRLYVTCLVMCGCRHHGCLPSRASPPPPAPACHPGRGLPRGPGAATRGRAGSPAGPVAHPRITSPRITSPDLTPDRPDVTPGRL